MSQTGTTAGSQSTIVNASERLDRFRSSLYSHHVDMTIFHTQLLGCPTKEEKDETAQVVLEPKNVILALHTTLERCEVILGDNRRMLREIAEVCGFPVAEAPAPPTDKSYE